jgi:3-mercaptopyruvate sulfurtransferase SseA
MAVLCSMLFSLPVLAVDIQAVSADAAAQALAQGATVVDVRSAPHYSAGHVAGAAWLPRDAATRPIAQLERLVSEAGIDLSRTVLVVGEPGDAHAQALWQTLGRYATGRVLWLVGGTLEWQMRGYALATHSAALPAVPQHLVALQAEPAQARMAGAAWRASAPTAQSGTLSFYAK